MKLWKIFSVLFLFLIISQIIIFGVDRDRWFDASFSVEIAHKLNTIGWNMTWQEEIIFIILPIFLVFASCIKVWKWGGTNE